MDKLIIIAHNIRSSQNVGALLRTAEGLGVSEVFLTGYTPYPLSTEDSRLPHLAQKINRRITKTALGAENLVPWSYHESPNNIIDELKHRGFTIAALEQSANAVNLESFKRPSQLALILGSEVGGINRRLLKKADVIIEIPMKGKKDSLNVASAAAIAIYILQI